MEATRFILIFVAIFVSILVSFCFAFIGFDQSRERKEAAHAKRIAEYKMAARLLRLDI
jgi:hypothetical protein